ncbi:hypothetical protein, partial [Clostridium sp.]|uniref:hypothetical protein n=1 Tax=Clostridium sp. TaxID=1506 RepID=UPI00283D64F4
MINHILSYKHQFSKNKPYQVFAKEYPELHDKPHQEYIENNRNQVLHHLYNFSRNFQDVNDLKSYAGGVLHNTHAMTHKARQHFQEHARKNLEHQAKLHNLRLGHDPNFYKHEEKSDSKIFDKIQIDFNKLIAQLKNNNYSRDVVTYVFDIQNLLVEHGYNLTAEQLYEVKKFASISDELLDADIIRSSMDIKDRGTYETVADGLKNIIQAAKALEPYSNSQLRERKFAQEGIKKNLQKELYNEEKIYKDFGMTEEKVKDKLRYDRTYQDYLKQKKEEQKKINMVRAFLEAKMKK